MTWLNWKGVKEKEKNGIEWKSSFFYFPLLLHNLSSNTEWVQGSTHEWGSIRKEKIVL